jgi:hypothetical protein
LPSFEIKPDHAGTWEIPVYRLQGQTDSVFKTESVFPDEYKRYFLKYPTPFVEMHPGETAEYVHFLSS